MKGPNLPKLSGKAKRTLMSGTLEVGGQPHKNPGCIPDFQPTPAPANRPAQQAIRLPVVLIGDRAAQSPLRVSYFCGDTPMRILKLCILLLAVAGALALFGKLDPNAVKSVKNVIQKIAHKF
jgi:hypothetical protein